MVNFQHINYSWRSQAWRSCCCRDSREKEMGRWWPYCFSFPMDLSAEPGVKRSQRLIGQWPTTLSLAYPQALWKRGEGRGEDLYSLSDVITLDKTKLHFQEFFFPSLQWKKKGNSDICGGKEETQSFVLALPLTSVTGFLSPLSYFSFWLCMCQNKFPKQITNTWGN